MKKLLLYFLFMATIASATAQNKKPLVKIARVTIDPAQLDSYKKILTEEVQTAVRIEPGVLSISVVADQKNPNQIMLLEVYTDEQAYLAHRETPHFKKYKTETKDMVKSLELMDVAPILLASKKN
jgi:quinol monooxygenase YgiN